MNVSRRNMLLGGAALAAGVASAAGAAAPGASPYDARADVPITPSLPDKTSFMLDPAATYLDSGSQHPLSKGGRAAMDAYLAKRMFDSGAAGYVLPSDRARERFARLINAGVDEISFVQSTTTAEQMILRALGLPWSGGHIVTDTLHFFGSIPIYEEMAKRGVDVTWVHHKGGRIEMADMKKAIRKGTKLVSLSLVSTINGFQHDLREVCKVAHEYGALVYADIIHAAGCMPLDVKESKVNFAACASYKWLMGDFGLGFAYISKDAQDKLQRSEYGYFGLEKFEPYIYPFDPPGNAVADYAFDRSAHGLLAQGTRASAVIALLDHSLAYIAELGVPRIQAHAQALTDHLKEELTKLGHVLMTPPGTRSPLVTCVLENAAAKLSAKLQAQNITITMSRHRFRVTPSVFNDHRDIDRLLSAIGRA